MKTRMWWWMVLVAVVAITGAAAAQTEGEALAGVYAVRRVVTSSTCTTTASGGVNANLYMISADPAITVVVAGTTAFPELRGTLSGTTLTLTGSNGQAGTLSVSLTTGAGGVLSGTETMSLVQGGNACTIVRSVTATPLTPAERARPRR